MAVHYVSSPVGLETKGYPVTEEVRISLGQLLSCCNEPKENKAKRIPQVKGHGNSEGPPPNDYRYTPIFPEVEEITTHMEPYLRSNVVQGEYQDLDHYLDVHFRLLRQDFLEPLNKGITMYLETLQEIESKKGQKESNDKEKKKDKPKMTDIYIYHDVRVLFPICSNDGMTHRLSFDISKLKKVRWQATKRLIFGSLVCLSKDNFRSVFFATVANRQPQDLKNGLVDVRFQGMDLVSEIDSSDSFVMAESSAYFEAYRHVLKGLQETTETTLPLQRYIVEVSKEVLPPSYLKDDRDATYNLSYLANPDTDHDDYGTGEYPRKGQSSHVKEVKILKRTSWPEAKTLHLDKSQLRAVQAALTQEVAIIQGPPGTGKTYIGLKIVQALLHNSAVWNGGGESNPILVVCYTNHALDQFLEGIMEFNQNIVRVGGRSKSEDMKTKNLNLLRSEYRRGKKVQRAVHLRINNIFTEMQSSRRVMELSQKKIEKTFTGIISEDYLQPFMSKRQYTSLTAYSKGSDFRGPTSCILEWLGLSATGQNLGISFQNDVGDSEDEEQDDDDDVEVDEEAALISEQRILDDEEEDMISSDGEGSEKSHIVLDVEHPGLDISVGEGWQVQAGSKKKMKTKLLRKLRKTDRMSEKEADRIEDVWTIGNIDSRWQLYRYWASEYCNDEHRRMEAVLHEFDDLTQELKEVRVEEDLSILRHASVIGMTTTGAAKHRNVLQRLGPKIVIVEEAAEVLESHIITTLSAECQHLILIGDHQQLRPKPTVYRLEKDFNFGISLFERLIKNDLPFQTLVQQHRMRPEISTIMKSRFFYPDLKDHTSVRNYPHVTGIRSDVFFLNHDFPENAVDDSMSKSNLHEAEVLVGLCKYLLQQGQYKASQITILTAYVGQLFNFKELMKKSVFFKDVRVCSVDNYQGEENDIILLSLVRSNSKGKIGFLNEPNRACVALSRARHGFYCVGNFNCLKSKSPLWKEIVDQMERNGLYGEELQLVCHNHPKTVTLVSNKSDFLKCPDGGCGKACEYRLKCGHSCTLKCHPDDPEHKVFKCLKACDKVLKCGHQCSLLCFKPCGKCTRRVYKTLPCGHRNQLFCYQKPESAVCQMPCAKQLTCGHQCRRKCGEDPCTEVCHERILSSDWPCGHAVQVTCSDGPEKCTKECRVVLECSHPCQGSCGACERGRLHVQCKQKCNRTLVCGHRCTALCTRECPPCAQKCQNRCVHCTCPNRCGDPCTPCQEACLWRCPHYRCRKTCSEACDRPPCDRPCPARVRCGHPCIGLCGEPCPDKCRVCHRDEVTEIFFGCEDEPDARFVQLEDCGHVFEVDGLDQWMQVTNEGQKSIQLKVCPRCRTPIRRNRRYGNIIKEALGDIEKVKARIFGEKKQIEDKKEQITRKLSLLKDVDSVKKHIQSPRLSLTDLLMLENKVNLLVAIRKAKKRVDGSDIPEFQKQMRQVRRDLSKLKQWLWMPREYLSHQELDDGSSELQRLDMCSELYHIKSKLRSKTDLKEVEDLVLSGKPLRGEAVQRAKMLLKRLKRQCGGMTLGISETKRVMIVKAVGLTQGHWFKCPNGHFYVIGECGGATKAGTCPECKAKIGGGSHRLRGDNKLASEMDGARVAAWSDVANMANFDLRELQD